MSLIVCLKCGVAINGTAKFCPSCGSPIIHTKSETLNEKIKSTTQISVDENVIENKKTEKVEMLKPATLKVNLIIGAVIVLILASLIIPHITYKSSTSTPTVTPSALVRAPSGATTDLSAGLFTVGTDIATGIYDVTPLETGSGNFSQTDTNGNLLDNEILTTDRYAGILKLRVVLTPGDVLNISGINKVHFQPVNTSFVTTVKSVTLTSGLFMVNQDIVAGRYVVTTLQGPAGTVMTYDSNANPKVRGVLGGTSSVSGKTVDLAVGDIIKISGLNNVTFTPSEN